MPEAAKSTVLVDETAQRPLLMPLGDLFGSVTEASHALLLRGSA
jgi:hypothetical protein